MWILLRARTERRILCIFVDGQQLKTGGVCLEGDGDSGGLWGE